MEQTLSIIKPDAVKKGVIGKIIDRFESNNLRIATAKKLQLSRADAQSFYAIHKDRPFFKDLVDFMISGPVVVMVLEGDNAVSKNRELMGARSEERRVGQKALFALILQKVLTQMQFTAAIALRMQKMKLPFSLVRGRFAN